MRREGKELRCQGKRTVLALVFATAVTRPTRTVIAVCRTLRCGRRALASHVGGVEEDGAVLQVSCFMLGLEGLARNCRAENITSRPLYVPAPNHNTHARRLLHDDARKESMCLCTWSSSWYKKPGEVVLPCALHLLSSHHSLAARISHPCNCFKSLSRDEPAARSHSRASTSSCDWKV